MTDRLISDIQGEKVSLALATPRDTREYVACYNSLAVKVDNFSFYANLHGALTLEKERFYLNRMFNGKDDFLFMVRRRENGRLLGTVGLHDRDAYNDTARLGVLIFPDEQGKGYGGEAVRLIIAFGFNDLKMNKIYLNVFQEKENSRAFYRKIGFKENGIRPEHYKLRGVYHDMVEMCILKRDWKK